jgi:hypothetical protein
VFETYRLDNHQTDEQRYLGGWSYVWGALGGPFYVLAKGCVLAALLMVPITVALAAGVAVALTIVVGLIGDFRLNIVAAAALPLIGLAAQGVIAVQLVRAAFLRSGWREGY